MTYRFTYRVDHTNGKYYVGRHSTDNIDDGYIGSGLWPRSIKDKSQLTRTILEYADTFEELLELEKQLLAEHVGQPDCMNFAKDPIGFDTDNNPMKNPEVVGKLSGDNHWTRKNPENVLRGETHWMNTNLKARARFDKNNPLKTAKNRKAASDRIKERNKINNPSTRLAAEGKHHWQNGKSPNAGGKLNQKLIEEGRHNFLGPEHNRRMIAEGKNPWVGPDANRKRLEAGTHPSQQKKTCEHCGKTTSIGMYKRWHGDRCKSQSNLPT